MNKTLYYLLNIFWGFPMTCLGFIIALGLLFIGQKPHKHGGCVYFNIGHNWGGWELGLFFIIDKENNEQLRCHEYGHSLQNALWGPLMPFVICVPSAIRYWIITFRKRAGKPVPKYDSIWFEGQATQWGLATIDQWS